MARKRTVVLGGGIEGLVAAAMLAKAGRRVTLIEEREVVGGVAAREEFHPGYRTPGVLHETSHLCRGLLASLQLDQHGLRFREDEEAIFVPSNGIEPGPGFLYHRDTARLKAELPSAHGSDAEAHDAFVDFLGRVGNVVRMLLEEAPPEPRTPRAAELVKLSKRALQIRRLGEADLFELMRVVPQTADDWMRDLFGNESLRVAVTAPALIGTVLGPRAPGTGGLVLLRECLRGPEVAGGPAALVDALESCAKRWKVALRLGQRVRGLKLDDGSVTAVELENGETVEATCVLSTLGAKRTLLELVPRGHLPLEAEEAIRTWRARGALSVFRFALSKEPSFLGREGRPVERVVTAGSLVELERAADAIKYRELPEEPWLDVRVQSRSALDLAPRGHAVVTVLASCTPHGLKGGWGDDARSCLSDAVEKVLERIAPGFGESVVGRELLAPPDLAERFSLEGGHLFEGELALDQLWIQRPSLVLGRYQTPIGGLVLGGSSSHPGGPFLGGAGALAAGALLS